jgi:hypothetical protein
MKRPYCCDDSREFYERYYDLQQKGRGEFPVYVGRYTQKGHGIGNIIGSLFRRILSSLKALAPHVLRTGANVLEDVVKGKSWKESAIKRVPEGLRNVTFEQPESFAPHLMRTGANVLEDVSQGKSWKESAIKRASEGLHNWQSGSGLKRKRKHRDIYD